MRLTFAFIAGNVEKNTKRTFTQLHLAQLLAVYPQAYSARWECRSNGTRAQMAIPELVLQPNLKTGEYISLL